MTLEQTGLKKSQIIPCSIYASDEVFLFSRPIQCVESFFTFCFLDFFFKNFVANEFRFCHSKPLLKVAVFLLRPVMDSQHPTLADVVVRGHISLVFRRGWSDRSWSQPAGHSRPLKAIMWTDLFSHWLIHQGHLRTVSVKHGTLPFT